MATGSSLTQNYSRSQAEFQGDLHTYKIYLLAIEASNRPRLTGIVRGDAMKIMMENGITSSKSFRSSDIRYPPGGAIVHQLLRHFINPQVVNWSPKMMPTWLDPQHLAMFPLNRIYNFLPWDLVESYVGRSESVMGISTLLKRKQHETKLLLAASQAASRSMLESTKSIAEGSNERGVSVDDTRQKRDYSSLNEWISAISVNSGKILYIEVFNIVEIFERSDANRGLRYASYYADGDSKTLNIVKDMYGIDSVIKYEFLGHVQKRVSSHL
ncbi:uncharacterized protein TNCV_333891 [Trichonephila clavipes]|nr:uncharacterized protein TNCV_333891 [Trichonephila clavipes]